MKQTSVSLSGGWPWSCYLSLCLPIGGKICFTTKQRG